MDSSDCWSVKTCASLPDTVSPASVRDVHRISLDEQQKCSIPATPISRRKNKKHRSVSFELDSDGSIKQQVAPHDALVLTDEERKKLWWSAGETYVIAEKLRNVAMYYRRNRSDYKNDFLCLFLQCSRSPITSEEGREADQRGRRSARGLERHINEILPHYRNRYVETILDIQSKMPKDMPPDIKARLLRVKGSSLSKPSRNLARFLAHQDEIEVGENTLKEFHESSITI